LNQLAPMCEFCSRRNWETGECSAFPEGIPEAIYSGGADHRKPIKGDHGFQFAQDPSRPEFDFADAGRSLILSESIT